MIKSAITDPLAKSLLLMLTAAMKNLALDVATKSKKMSNDLTQRINDLISYLVCCGLLDKYHRIFQCIQEPLEDTSTLLAYHTAIEMLQSVVATIVRYLSY